MLLVIIILPKIDRVRTISLSIDCLLLKSYDVFWCSELNNVMNTLYWKIYQLWWLNKSSMWKFLSSLIIIDDPLSKCWSESFLVELLPFVIPRTATICRNCHKCQYLRRSILLDFVRMAISWDVGWCATIMKFWRIDSLLLMIALSQL